jgi:DNA-directed RNA polymerase specialized sigma24 family protein
VNELLTSRPPDRPAEQGTPELRIMVLDALATLPPKARAVVVLRYWEDLSVEQVAVLLGCSPGNVKSRAPARWTSCAPCSATPWRPLIRGPPAPGKRPETGNHDHG